MIASVGARQSKGKATRADELFARQQFRLHARMDRMFAGLMLVQWIAGIATAFWISPRTWSGGMSQTHLHVWLAIFLGGAITTLPVYMAWFWPGKNGNASFDRRWANVNVRSFDPLVRRPD